MKKLVLHMSKLCALPSRYVYAPFKHTPGMWHHTTHPVTFMLAVDEFGIRYFDKAEVDHLLYALREK